jgi:flagellar biogenesis protein FliO
MKRRLLLAGGVIAVTVGVTGLAFADEDAPKAALAPAATAAPTTAAPAAAPLAPTTAVPAAAPLAPPAAIRTITEPSLPLRAPAPALELAKPAPSSSWGTRIGLVVLAGLGGFAFLRAKKRGGRGAKGGRDAASASRIVVHARTSLALRTEVAVVEVSGLRLLLGITPHAIQTLAVLPELDGEAAELAADMERAREDAEAEAARTRPLAPSDPARLRAPLAAQLEGPSLADRARALFESPDRKLAAAALSIASAAKYASRATDISRDERDAEDLRDDEALRDEPAPAPKPSTASATRRTAARGAAREREPRDASTTAARARMPRDGDGAAERGARASLLPARSSRPPVEGQARGLVLALGNKR